MNWDRQYQINNITRLHTKDYPKFPQIYNFKDQIVLLSPDYGLSTLQFNNNMFKLVSFISNNCWYGITYRDKLIFIYPEIQVFDGRDFGTSENQISMWPRL